MRVLFLQQQPCVRALKYAVGLRGQVTLGFAFRGRTLSELYGAGDELFERWYPLGADPEERLPDVIEAFAPDVIHSHNLPDELTVLAIDATDGRIPVIHDVHDMQSLRRTPYEDGYPEPEDPIGLERRAAQEAAAVVTVSPELVAELAARYRLPRRVLAYANYALRRDLPRVLPPPRPLDGPPRLVYQGTLSTNGGHYDLRELFAAIAEQGISLDVYPAREVPEYREIPGIRVHRTLPLAELLERLTEYDLGWAGFNTGLNRAHLDTALPNKLYEYLGCGLPVITLRHRALRRMLRDEGVGIVLDDVGELAAALAEADVEALRRRVAAARERFTVEAQIGRIAALYREVAAAGGELERAVTAAG
jgi:glycosyltransferase involved in cell wall biosynthesis